MGIGDLSKLVTSGDQAKVPDLDWLELDIKDKDNIPTSLNVEIIPQLVDAWTHEQPKSVQLIDNQEPPAKVAGSVYTKKDVQDVVDTAKKEMMLGSTGKSLADKIGSTYPIDLIERAKDDLSKVASEQGLLGSVYIDLSAFETCKQAAQYLGRNRIRMAKYATGNPKKSSCGLHDQGMCKELNKKVVASMEYSSEVLSEYTDHFRVAGLIGGKDVLDSKESLRSAIIKKQAKKNVAKGEAKKDVPVQDFEVVQKAFEAELTKKAASDQLTEKEARFHEVRPILAFIQNEMLRGKMGNSLKEAIAKNFTENEIKKYASEVSKVASLQGLLGNVYVDVSLYRNTDEAISAIKNASTSPTYVVQTKKTNEYDDSVEKVAKATGCLALPKDGRIDKKIAYSYIEDLQFSDRISFDVANKMKTLVESSDNVLSIIRDSFLATMDHKKSVREGGVAGTFFTGGSKKEASRTNLTLAVREALDKGLSIDHIENKLSSYISPAEAIGMVRTELSAMKEVNASTLANCTGEKYQLQKGAVLKQASKCSGCVLRNCSFCMSTGLKFKGASEVSSGISIDPNTKKVMYEENPDAVRMDINKEFDMSDNFGSGMNIALDNMRESRVQDVEDSFNQKGIDLNLSE